MAHYATGIAKRLATDHYRPNVTFVRALFQPLDMIGGELAPAGLEGMERRPQPSSVTADNPLI